ncbi:MAG: hypothetical protein WCY58_09030 [Mariniphaga sp.]|nr:hypothetical protein [Mariniphaga sp.]MDD4224934.1 hypothetical protein [Mariniphaga sp.]MDD4424704.1 hypothetical protein [Mariniphaga sp.]
MFTVGIFSTHIPYLAFVFFYALFFLFGLQKEPFGNATSEENVLTSKISVATVKSSVIPEILSENEVWSYSDLPEKEKVIRLGQITVLYFPPGETKKSKDYYFLHFSRPPPGS